MLRPQLAACVVCVAAIGLSGCGNERAPTVTRSPGPSARTHELRYPRAGLTVALPRNLLVDASAKPPAVLRATLGEPFVSAYAYRRREQLPRNAAELGDARVRLVRTVRRRDPAYRLESSRTTRIGGAAAVELLGDQTFSTRRLRVRSLHVFKGGAEYVIEVAGPGPQFSRFDRAITPVIRRTLRVTGRVRGS